MSYKILPYTMDHYDEIYDLWTQTEGIGISECDSRQGIEKLFKKNPDMSFVAIDNDKIVAGIMASHDGRRGCLYHLAVKPQYRRLGLGKELVKKSLNALKKDGIDRCYIVVFANNEQGKQFWRSIDWKIREEINMASIIID